MLRPRVAIHDGLADIADIAGIDQDLIDLFSKRREQIEATMVEWGLTSAKAAQVSTLETRRAKAVESEPLSEQIDRWRIEALTTGVDSATLQLEQSVIDLAEHGRTAGAVARCQHRPRTNCRAALGSVPQRSRC